MAKKRVAGVTADGLRYARRSAARTAAQILSKTVAHHVREATQEAEIAEGVEYRDEIKASIKEWAFRVRRWLPAPESLHAPRSACIVPPLQWQLRWNLARAGAHCMLQRRRLQRRRRLETAVLSVLTRRRLPWL